MSGDNAHMNKVHFEKSFLFELYPDFRLCEILLASFVTALLASSERIVVNRFWTSNDKLCQVSSSSIHTLKLYQRAILRSKSYTKQTTTRTTTVSDICFCTPDKTRKIN